MIKKKQYDGVVVAVHYSLTGEIDWVRAFLRHGFVFSDRITMDRESLIHHLQEGKRFKTGERNPYLGNDFKILDDIRLIENGNGGGKRILAGEESSTHDSLGNLPAL